VRESIIREKLSLEVSEAKASSHLEIINTLLTRNPNKCNPIIGWQIDSFNHQNT